MDHNGKAQTQPVVMIVDDEEMVITSVRAFLSLETDYDIHGFTDPEEAARFMETHPVDVVVSDYLMPKMNGIEICRAIRSVNETIVIFFCSGAVTESDKEAAFAAGAQGYITKPFEPHELAGILSAALAIEA